MNGLNGVFGTVSSIGTQVTAGTEYRADMAPKPITETKVPTRLPTHPQPILGDSAAVVGESIFGQFLYAADSVPQMAAPSWQAGSIAPPISGFGDPIDQAIPADFQWGGHGIFGGRSRRGPYGMSRYGEPVQGFGAISTTGYVVGAAALMLALGAGAWFYTKKKKGA